MRWTSLNKYQSVLKKNQSGLRYQSGLIIFSAALAACTPMEWRRGGEVATLESDDFKQCNSSAILEAMRQMPFSGIHPSPMVGRDRFGRTFVIHPSWSRTDQLMLEHTNMNLCLSRLGYELVPIAREIHPRATGSGTQIEPKPP